MRPTKSTKSTKRVGLAGYPIDHSLSPALHNAVYRELGLDWEYRRYPCVDTAAFATLLARLRASDEWVGLNVTTPCKPLAFAACDHLAPDAQASRAVNVLTCAGSLERSVEHAPGAAPDAAPALDEGPGHLLVGDNTDGRGLLAALARETGMSPTGRHFVVLGSGAVSRSVVAALERQGAASITILSRKSPAPAPAPDAPTPTPTPALASALASAPASASAPSASPRRGSAVPLTLPYACAPEVLAAADVLIDATTLGMHPDDPPALSPELLRSDLVVLDTVYGHGQTALLKAARACGAAAFDGLGMLVEQAALSIEVWLGAQGLDATVPRDLMYTVARGAAD
jgi:shikimate dehydrogenase